MSKMITGSMCLNDILDHARAKHSAFRKAENGKIYFNILVWQNDEPDQFNNNFSMQLNPVKDAPDTEKKKYIGNMKFVASNATPIQDGEIPDTDSLGIGTTFTQPAVELPETDGLPF